MRAAAPLLAAHVTVSGTGEAVVFWILGPVSVIAALAMVVARRAVHSALMLALVMICLAAFYAAQDAPFLAFVQVIVYTGAVMMLFLFVLMLVGVRSAESLVEILRGQRVAASLFGLGFALLLVVGIARALVATPTVGVGRANLADGGNVQGIAHLLFTRYVFAFEATSALLITAALGAMVLAHREALVARPSQKERAMARFGGPRPSPLPGPGVFADHDSVATPALLPDGSVAPGSVDPAVQRVALPTAALRAEDAARLASGLSRPPEEGP